jgi:hypothetical protein
MSIEVQGSAKARGIAARLLFPSHVTRLAIAAALTFFPYALMYPLEYPAPELIALSAWIWSFPSWVGFAAFALAPLIPTETYGYYAFNLFCVVANLSIAMSASSSKAWRPSDFETAHKIVRCFMLITLVICAMQVVTDPGLWSAVFPHMVLEPGRGAGLKLEPSQIGSLLAIYLSVLVARLIATRKGVLSSRTQSQLVREAVQMIVGTVLLTRSLTVLIVACCFLFALFPIKRKQVLLAAAVVLACLAITNVVFGDRLHEAIETSGGDPTEFITASLSSWRNTPDLLIITDPSDFMMPGKPSEVRLRLHDSAVLLSPLLGWIQNTFTLFSAGGVTLGLPITLICMGGVLVGGLRKLRKSSHLCAVWLLCYVAGWVVLAKWDDAMWLTLGILQLVPRITEGGSMAESAADHVSDPSVVTQSGSEPCSPHGVGICQISVI